MFSTPKLLACVVSAVAVAGCTKAYQPVVEKLSPAPIVHDEAMAIRDWESITSYYSYGASVSYPTLYPYVARRNAPPIEPIFVEPFLFITQTAAVPVTALVTPPWQDTTYRGVYTPPTYTAIPVIEPDYLGYIPITKWEIVPPRRR